MSSDNSSRITARWVFPVDSPPIEDGVIEFIDGVITDVRPSRGALDSGAADLGNVAILPGLINAHAHLEFSDLDEPIQPPAPFTDWIRSLLEHRRNRRQSMAELIGLGLQLSTGWGTSTVGDIVTGDWTPNCIAPHGPRTIAFRELIGLLPDQADAQLEIARRHIEQCRESSLPVRPAISPHAPYSVSAELFHKLIELADKEDVPLCIHLAETQTELQLLADGTGELFEMLASFGIWKAGLIGQQSRPLDYLRPLARLNHAIIAHGNYLAPDEIEFLCANQNVAVAFCPRTHRFFGHADHPWRQLIDGGATVCLGTDGCSSNPDYSLWSEVQFLDGATRGHFRPELLELATINGARALGLDDATGTLSPGRLIDHTIVRLPDRDGTDPWELLFSPEARIGNGYAWHPHARNPGRST